MIALADFNTLPITRFTDHGAYMDGGDVGEILLPKAYVRPEMRPGDEVTVFVYLDQSERLVGTFEQPLVRAGQCACLRCAWTNRHGAFLDWGLMKDLFVPFSEQRRPMEMGGHYVVHCHIDPETQRVVASAKIDRYLRPATHATHRAGQQVDVLVWHATPLGYKAIVDHQYQGQLYADQLYAPVRPGERIAGSVVRVRPDGKLDLAVGRLGTDRFRDFADTLLDALRQAPGGVLPYGDHSAPDDIRARFGVSKKTFKQALGTLYRQRLVSISEAGICLLEPSR
ncbi:MAG: GntR family transcriptional regulator [Bacteroidaceae bacterium]|nr:GntR family transcriptional regulator [Bacteroidaceae bacterium]